MKEGWGGEPPPQTPGAASAGARGQGLATAIELAVNIALPWVAYTLLKDHVGEFYALAASAAPPVLWNIYELIRFRKVDALSLFILGGIVLSMLAVVMGGSPRMLLVRENLFSIPVGAAFLITAWARQPVLQRVASAIIARSDPAQHVAFMAACARPRVRAGLRVMSIVWGLGLAGQGALLGWMALTWPIGTYLILNPVIGYGAIIALSVWTYWYRTTLREEA